VHRDDAISPLSELGGLSRLSAAAARRDPAAIDAVAKRFEALFAEMMVSSMRSASLGDPLFEGQNTMYRELYDRELAARMASGRGLGIADMLRRQLGGEPDPAGATSAAATANAAAPASTGMALSSSLAAPVRAAALSSAPVHAPQLPALPRVPDYFPDPQLAAIDASCGFADHPGVAGFPEAPLQPVAAPKGAANLAAPRAGTPEAFVSEVWPHAQAAAAEIGVDPRMLVAQAALETGWGRSVMRGADGRSSHNLFGIKATGGWDGHAVSQSTVEFRQGVMQRERASFRAYASVGESFADYVRLVRDNPRYRDALAVAGDAGRFADELARAGYATDPQYAAKLKAIVDGPTMRRALAQLPLAGTQRA
jgi:flagellar protein FlgJ